MSGLLASRPFYIVLILAVAFALTLPSLGSTSLWDIDEGLNAEAAREMLESGDWVVPYFNFRQRTAKPAMLYWLQAAAYRAFGVNEFAARLPSALSSALTALLIYWLGRRMFSATTGLLAAIIFVTTIQAGVLSHAATPDALLLLCFTLTFVLFWIGYAGGGRAWLWLPAAGCALAALAKGPVGLVLPAAVVGYFLLAQRQLGRLWDWRMLFGVVLFIFVAGPWYVLVGVETHGAFLRAFWQNENVGRFVSSLEGHRGPAWYYAVTLIIGLAPWCVFLLPTVWETVLSLSRRIVAAEIKDANERTAVRFLTCWIAVYIGFFSLAQTKLPNYVYPVFPAVALLTARGLDRWRLGQSALPKWVMSLSIASLGVVGLVAAGVVLVAGGVLLPAAMKGRAIAGLGPWALLGVVPVLGAILAISRFQKERRTEALVVICGVAFAFLAGFAFGPLGIVESEKGPKALVAQAGVCRPDAEIRIASLGYFQPSLVFYCQREVRELLSGNEAIDFLRGPLPAYLFCPADLADAVRARLPSVEVLARHRDLYRGSDVVVLGNGRDTQFTFSRP